MYDLEDIRITTESVFQSVHFRLQVFKWILYENGVSVPGAMAQILQSNFSIGMGLEIA